jgi:hypothetical protein
MQLRTGLKRELFRSNSVTQAGMTTFVAVESHFHTISDES